MAVLVFSWAYRAADGRRHDFTFLNQGTFFLKWGTFFLLFLTFPYFSLLSLYFGKTEKERKKNSRKRKKNSRKRKRTGKEQKKKRQGPLINSEKRPQADTTLSRPVWPQFCFYPLRIIPQGTQSQGLRMWSVFGGVENSMFLGLC